MEKDKNHFIQLEKCVVVLTSKEIKQLLLKNTELFKTALQRGKKINRSMKQKNREKNKYEIEK